MENKKYKVIGEIEILDEKGVKTGELFELGSIQEVPTKIGNKWIKEGLAELVDGEPSTSRKDDYEAKVYNKNNQVVRVYSKEVHGAGFKKLAEEFAAKFGYSLNLK